MTGTLTSLSFQTQGELLAHHGISPEDFDSWTLTMGPGPEYLEHLEQQEHKIDVETRPGQTGTRANEKRKLDWQRQQSGGGWSLYGVALEKNTRKPTEGRAYLGVRIHPSKRKKRADGSIFKFGCTAWNPITAGLFLPPISYEAALRILHPYGFRCNPLDYAPHLAWLFVLSHRDVPLWIEESALKAMASTSSFDQLALGLNGISSSGPKGRSDRLKGGLAQFANGRHQIIVRFDGSTKLNSQSQDAARQLARKLMANGAINASWFTWWDKGRLADGGLKTDDVAAAILKGHVLADVLRLQSNIGVDDRKARKLPYSRMMKWEPNAFVDREFEGADISEPIASGRRVIALWGATGTGKTKATVAAVETIEERLGQKLIVLGAYHRKTLTGKGAFDFGVRSMSAEPRTAEREGWISERDGLFCCGESAYKPSGERSLWTWAWDLKENPRLAVLVLDELTQSLPTWAIGGSPGMLQVREKAVEALEMLVANPYVTVVAADAFLGDIELDWLQGVSGADPWLVKSTFTRKRSVFLGSNQKADLRLLLAQMQSVNAKHGSIWVGAGQKDTLGELLSGLVDAGRTIRIDGDTNRDPISGKKNRDFITNVNTEGRRYRVVAFSPAMSSGVSFEAETVDISGVVQSWAWTAADAVQSLNRARDSRVRVLLAPDISPDAKGVFGETTPEKVKDVISRRAAAGNLPDFVDKGKKLHPATMNAILALDARQTREAAENARVVRAFLLQEGYEIRPLLEVGSGQTVCNVTTTPEDVEDIAPVSTETRLATACQAAIQRLMLGTSSLEEERTRAKLDTIEGTMIDMVLADVSKAWEWFTRWKLDQLIQLGSVLSGADEIEQVWAELCTMTAKEWRQACNDLSTAEGKLRWQRMPDVENLGDRPDVRKIWPLVKAAGFVRVPLKAVRVDGVLRKGWTFQPMQEEVD